MSLLVRTDGTAAGTTVVRSFPAFSEFYTQQIADLSAVESFIEKIVPLGERTLFLSSPDLGGPTGLWVTDGTAAGTRQLLYGLTTSPSGLFAAGDQAFFASGSALRRTDGTEEGTRELRDFMVGPGSGGPLDQVVLNGRLVFSAQTSFTAAPLFSSDGTRAGTHLVAPGLLGFQSPSVLGNQLLFGAATGGTVFGLLDLELFRSDGTTGGTRLVKNIDPF